LNNINYFHDFNISPENEDNQNLTSLPSATSYKLCQIVTEKDSLESLSPLLVLNELNNAESEYCATSPCCLYVVEKLVNGKNLIGTSNKSTSDDDEFQNLNFFKVPHDSHLNEESRAVENWNRRSKTQRKSTSYLNPNRHLRHLNINTSSTKMTLVILKNISSFAELKSCKSKEVKVILSNTCASDSLTSLIMVSNILYVL